MYHDLTARKHEALEALASEPKCLCVLANSPFSILQVLVCVVLASEKRRANTAIYSSNCHRIGRSNFVPTS